nr:hypothetical protein [uncultured Cohaesibacter sp.]
MSPSVQQYRINGQIVGENLCHLLLIASQYPFKHRLLMAKIGPFANIALKHHLAQKADTAEMLPSILAPGMKRNSIAISRTVENTSAVDETVLVTCAINLVS